MVRSQKSIGGLVRVAVMERTLQARGDRRANAYSNIFAIRPALGYFIAKISGILRAADRRRPDSFVGANLVCVCPDGDRP